MAVKAVTQKLNYVRLLILKVISRISSDAGAIFLTLSQLVLNSVRHTKRISS